MMTQTETQLHARGRMAFLLDEIKSLSRERDNLLRPLRERLYRALPPDRFPSDMANRFDVRAAREEIAAIERAESRLAEALDEYNRLAPVAGQPELKRKDY
jgi:hypothetical protein